MYNKPTNAEEMEEFERMTTGFDYVYEDTVGAGKIIYLKMPVVSANKRGVNDIGWQCDGDDVALYATMSRKPRETELWSEVKENYVVNKTVSALKVENKDTKRCNICVRVRLN